MQEAISKRDRVVDKFIADSVELGFKIYDEVLQVYEEARLYKTAWLELAKCLGEIEDSQALEFMDTILNHLKSDMEV